MDNSSVPILQCNNLTKQFGGITALNSLNISVPKGKIVGLLGSNGSGKTTLIKLASSLLVPTSGEILINGQKPCIETKKMISYLPDKTYLPNWMTVKNIIGFFADFYVDFDKIKAYDMLKRLNINENSSLKSLSKGTKEKVQLILVMSRNTQLYLLDEPIGGVDPAARDYILNTIITNYNENSTILISTHLISDIEKVLDDVFFISNGQVVLYSSVDQIREEHGKSVDELFREVFKC